MHQCGRVLAVDAESDSLRVTIAAGGRRVELRLPATARVPPVGAFVRATGTSTDALQIDVIGQPPTETGHDAARWWRPYATRPTRMERLTQRASIVRAARDVLDRDGFLEVQVPLLVQATCPDVHIDSFRFEGRYLTTSTEYQLKRMFAGGFEKLYTLTQNFREGDRGTFHNPEFTMLEWARAYASLDAIERDAEAVVRHALAAIAPESNSVEFGGHTVEIVGRPWERLTVHEALRRYLGVVLDDSFTLASMLAEIIRLGIEIPDAYRNDRKDVLTLLLDRIQHELGTRVPTFLVDWPAFLTTSAPLRPGRSDVTERSELFIAGVEVADGFPFLCDAGLQAALFDAANEARSAAGKPSVRLDARYLEALRGGLPPGAGMALGVDRLVMVLTGETDIRNVIAFAWDEL